MHRQSKREQRQLGLPAAIAVVTGEAIALGIFLKFLLPNRTVATVTPEMR